MAKYILLFLSLCTTAVCAQTNDLAPGKVQFSLAYFHSGTSNPGFQIGVDWVFKEMIKVKEKKYRNLGVITHRRKRQLALETRLGLYWDPLTHFSLFNQYLFSYRFIFQKPTTDHPSWTLALGIGPGYHRSLYEETYEVNENNEVKDLGWAGRGFFSTTIDFRFIRERRGKRLNAWFLGLNNVLLFDYNATVAPLSNIFFGFRFQLKSRT